MATSEFGAVKWGRAGKGGVCGFPRLHNRGGLFLLALTRSRKANRGTLTGKLIDPILRKDPRALSYDRTF